ncbi:hypothetical protein ABVK25_009231 [Lepraria finkii]|uniref:Uncharacterized protein n=1 Tax=Lepraria finkii TaxID=1340010 RepID=A0ABR4AY33_9LECA
MVAQYTVFGRQVGSHVLAMLTLGTTAAGSTWALAGKEKAKEQGPPINAQSNEEEQFIQEFIKNAQAEEQKAKH